MSNYIRKIGATLLAICLVLSMTVTAFAAETEDETTTVAIIETEEETLTYETLEAAIADAYEGDNVILVSDYTLSTEITIPANVQVTIPTSSSYNDTTTGNNASGSVVSGDAYVTLTVASGASVEVNGTLLVAGNQQCTTGNAGCLTGDYGAIDLDGTLTVNGTLYARGEISGEGTVTANSGATVYQLFQIHDWRGGTATSAAYGVSVFPFNLYDVNNITAKTVYSAGSSLIGQYFIYASNTSTSGEIPIIGEGAQFEFATNITSGNITFETASDGRTSVTINGIVSTNDMIIYVDATVFGYTLTTTFSTSGKDCPFGYSMDVTVADGSSLTVTNSMKILPGCTLAVEDGGALVVASDASLYLYSSDYAGAYNSIGWTSATPASLVIADTATVTNNGTIASSDSSFDNINGYTGVEGTATVYEYAPSLSSDDAYAVTFYTGEVSAESGEDAVALADIA